MKCKGGGRNYSVFTAGQCPNLLCREHLLSLIFVGRCPANILLNTVLHKIIIFVGRHPACTNLNFLLDAVLHKIIINFYRTPFCTNLNFLLPI